MILVMEILWVLLLIKLVLSSNKIGSFYGFLSSRNTISDSLGAELGDLGGGGWDPSYAKTS